MHNCIMFCHIQLSLMNVCMSFTANRTDALYQCRFGLRLNITVKSQKCNGPGGDPGKCWNQGRCLTSPLQVSHVTPAALSRSSTSLYSIGSPLTCAPAVKDSTATIASKATLALKIRARTEDHASTPEVTPHRRSSPASVHKVGFMML